LSWTQPLALSPSPSTASSASGAAVVPSLDDDEEASGKNDDGEFDVSCLLAAEVPSALLNPTAQSCAVTNDTEPAALFSPQMEALVIVMWVLWWMSPRLASSSISTCSTACRTLETSCVNDRGSQPSLMTAPLSTTGRGPVWPRPRWTQFYDDDHHDDPNNIKSNRLAAATA